MVLKSIINDSKRMTSKIMLGAFLTYASLASTGCVSMKSVPRSELDKLRKNNLTLKEIVDSKGDVVRDTKLTPGSERFKLSKEKTELSKEGYPAAVDFDENKFDSRYKGSQEVITILTPRKMNSNGKNNHPDLDKKIISPKLGNGYGPLLERIARDGNFLRNDKQDLIISAYESDNPIKDFHTDMFNTIYFVTSDKLELQDKEGNKYNFPIPSAVIVNTKKSPEKFGLSKDEVRSKTNIEFVMIPSEEFRTSPSLTKDILGSIPLYREKTTDYNEAKNRISAGAITGGIASVFNPIGATAGLLPFLDIPESTIRKALEKSDIRYVDEIRVWGQGDPDRLTLDHIFKKSDTYIVLGIQDEVGGLKDPHFSGHLIIPIDKDYFDGNLESRRNAEKMFATYEVMTLDKKYDGKPQFINGGKLSLGIDRVFNKNNPYLEAIINGVVIGSMLDSAESTGSSDNGNATRGSKGTEFNDYWN